VSVRPILGVPASLRAGVAWATGGSAVYLACQYGMLIAIAKLGSSANVGQYAMALAIAAPIIVLSQMQLRQVQVTDVIAETPFAHYVSTRLLATLIAAAAIVCTAVAIGYRGETFAVVGLVAVAKSFESISDIFHGRMQHRERMDVVARSLLLKGLLSLAALVMALYVTRSLAVAVGAVAVVWGVLLVVYDVPHAFESGERPARLLVWDPRKVGLLARTALPLTFAAGIGSLSTNIPRYFLEATHGNVAVGLFAVAAMPLALLGLLNTAVSQTTLARAAGHVQRGELQQFSRLGKRIAVIQVASAGMLAIVFATVGGPLMRILFTAEFVPAAPVAAVMAAGAAVGGLAAWGSTLLMAARRFRLQLWNILIVVAVQIPLCYVLIGPWGILGAGWSEFGRYGTSAVFQALAGLVVFEAVKRAAPPIARGERVTIPGPAV
jgi:O-antigen/teichoic acid export membrane protein